MKVMVKKASDYNFEEIRVINTLEELKQFDCDVIVSFDNGEDYKCDAVVVIYDDYVE